MIDNKYLGVNTPIIVDDIAFLSSDNLIFFNKTISLYYNCIFGVRDYNLLESCVNSVINFHYYNNENDIIRLMTKTCASIIYDHPFIDGNKRTAISSLFFLFGLNTNHFADNQIINNITKLNKENLYNNTILLAEKKIKEEDFCNYLKQNLIDCC